MNEQKFTQLLGGIDPALIARAEQSVPMRKKPSFRHALIAAMAAMLAMAMLLGVAAIAFIPKTYDLDYEVAKHENANKIAQIYYTENGKIKRQNVLLPPTEQNVFMTWKHLNTVGDEVKIVNYTVDSDNAHATVEPGTLWEYWQQIFSPATDTVTVTLSPQITSYENYDALIESLRQTIAKYAGVAPEQVKILIDGEQSAIVGGLQFWHSLQPQSATVVLGSTLEITVGMTNVSDKDIEFTGSWTAFVPSAILTMGNTAVIVHEEYQMTNEYAEYRLAPGESREITYTFLVPENATCGAYDLVVSFGEQTFTFEKAVQVVGFGYVPGFTGTEFHEFLIKYGFVTVDVSEFRSAVAQLTYHSGKGMFEIMEAADIDYAEGYSGEEYGSDLFAYGYLTEPNGSCNNYFIGLALPDDMRLPHGIAPGDRLVDSLHKMGLDADAAQDAVERAQALSEGEQLALGNEFFTFCITHNSYGEYVILYSFIAGPVAAGAGPPEYSLEIIYSEANMTFTCFRVKAGYEDYSSDAFTAPITVAPIWQSSIGRELNEEDTQKLIAILSNGTWKKGGVDVVCDYQITSANKVYSYSTSAGIFMSSNHYLSLSAEQQRIVNEMIADKSHAKITVNASGALAFTIEENTDLVIAILLRQQWTNGVIDSICNVQGSIECDDSRFQGNFKYNTYNRLFIVNQRYCTLSEEEGADLVHLLNSALVAPEFEASYIDIYLNGYSQQMRLEGDEASTLCNIVNNAAWEINVNMKHGSVSVIVESQYGWSYDPDQGYFVSNLFLGKLTEQQKQHVNRLLGLE